MLPLDLADQVFAGVHEAVYAVRDACFLAASKTTAWRPSDAPAEGMRSGIWAEKVIQLVPTHACEGEELAVGLSLSLALYEGCLYFFLRDRDSRLATRATADKDIPWLRRRSLVHPWH